jgi:hypothetical protein
MAGKVKEKKLGIWTRRSPTIVILGVYAAALILQVRLSAGSSLTVNNGDRDGAVDFFPWTF